MVDSKSMRMASVSSLANLADVDGKEYTDDVTRLTESVKVLLQGIGEDCTREGLIDTPKRVAKALLYVTRGYTLTGSSALGGAIFHEPDLEQDENGVVLVRDIDFASTCQETLLPFFGKCHVAYVPQGGRIAGLSKMARMAEVYGRRLQNQQNITNQLVAAVHEELEPLGAAVILQGTHLSSGQEVVTSACTGCFEGPGSHAWAELSCLLQLNGMTHVEQPGAAHAGCGGAADKGNAGETRLCKGHSQSRGWGHRGELDAEGGGEVPSSSSSEDDAYLERAGAGPDMEAAVEQMLLALGEDPERDGLRGSAARYVRRLLGATAGYRHSLAQALGDAGGAGAGAGAGAAGGAAEWVPYRDLPVSSQCEHHMLPFYGRVHVAVAAGAGGARALTREQAERVVELFTHRLQVQERLTSQLADAFMGATGAAGVCVVLEATHMCMVARGVQKTQSSTQTIASRGCFREEPGMRAAFLTMLATPPPAK